MGYGCVCECEHGDLTACIHKKDPTNTIQQCNASVKALNQIKLNERVTTCARGGQIRAAHAFF